MCGIVGYFGKRDVASLLLQGMSKLEYRGYDSAGVAILENGKIVVEKCKGRLKNLENKLKEQPIKGNIGIGHTRWATHGQPSDVNSHPHSNEKGTISVVHNGIIENYIRLRDMLINNGHQFVSETDTEVIPHLIDYCYEGDLLKAVMKATSMMEGSYAIGVISSHEPDKLVAVRKDNPMIVGLGKDENFIASDIPAVLNETRDIYLLNNKEFVLMDENGVQLFDEYGQKIEKEVYHVTWNADAAEKGGFEHFMMKEIHEQPEAIRNTLASRVALGEAIRLDKISLSKEQIEKLSRIYIVACGTAYHAGIVGKYAMEKLARIPVEVDIASEFKHRDPILDENSLVIVISQSGETADTLSALRLAKSQGARVIAVTNVVGSTVSREVEDVLYTSAGPEIAVASTKAYVTQLIAMYIIALYFAEKRNSLTSEQIEDMKKQLIELPGKVSEVVQHKEEIQKIASMIYMHHDVYFLGRGLDYAVAMEGSLKLKEISYIHSDAYAAGELKHGPIALMDKGTIVLTIATQGELIDKMVSNIKEVTARGARVFSFTPEGHKEIEEVSESTIYVPSVNPIYAPVVSVVPLQLLAYYVSVQKGCDVDKPRNLAKSVTVE